MADLAKLTKAPITVILDGQEYKASPIRASDLGAMEDYFRTRIYHRAREKLKEYGAILTVEERRAILDAADKEAQALSETEVSDTMSADSTGDNVAITAFLLWRMLLRHQPDMTLQTAADFIGSENTVEIERALSLATGMGKNSATPATESPSTGG